jgi:tetratricopeptide (TPR) repeat protein
MLFRQARESLQVPGDNLKKMQQVVALWPLEPEYRLNYARALALNGLPEATTTEWQAVRRLSGADPWFIAAGASLYTTLGENETAEKLYREALTLAPNVADFHLRLGQFLVDRQRWNPAREALERAVDLDTTYGEAYRELVKVYQALNLTQPAAWAQQQAGRWP